MHRFTSRKFVLALVGQLAGLVVLFYPSHEEAIVTAAQYIGGILVMALTAFGYIQGESRIDSVRVQGEQNREFQKESASRLIHELQQEINTLKDKTPPVLALALLIPVLALVGCKTSPGGYDMDEPLGQYDTAQEAFIQTVRTLNVGRQTGLFDDEEWATIVELIQEGDQILDEMEAAASADDSSVQTLYLETFQSILRRLVVWSIRVSNEEVSYGPQDRSDPRTVGLVRPGACDPSPQGQWPPARPEVPGGAEEAPQAPGRAVGRVAGHAGRRPAGGYAFGLDPAAGPDRSAVAVLRRVGGQWRIAG